MTSPAAHTGRPIICDNDDGTFSVLCCRRHLLYSRLRYADAWPEFLHPDAIVTCHWPDSGDFTFRRQMPDLPPARAQAA